MAEADNALQALIGRGREAHARGDLGRAERCLTQALDQGAERYADVHHRLGLIYHAWGAYTKARTSFEAALDINPTYTEAALNLAITYNDLGRYAEAQELLSRSLPAQSAEIDELSRGKIANLHADVGDAYLSAGHPGEAVVEYRRALGLCPGYLDIRARLADALTDDGRRDEAAEELSLVLSENPDFVPALLKLSLLCHALGRTEEARKRLEHVLGVDPDHERAKSYLQMIDVG